jgi:hypothetical protein
VLREIANENNISLSDKCSAAWELANHSVSVDIIEAGLRYETRPEISWARKDFNIQRLGFSQAQTEDNKFRLSEYINPVNLQKKHWLWNLGMAADVNRDWGRYIILKNLKKKILAYNKQTQELQVPLWVPLPCLLARAITLCSGMAPVIQENQLATDLPDGCLMQVYSDVPIEIARIVALKAGQYF